FQTRVNDDRRERRVRCASADLIKKRQITGTARVLPSCADARFGTARGRYPSGRAEDSRAGKIRLALFMRRERPREFPQLLVTGIATRGLGQTRRRRAGAVQIKFKRKV